MLGWLKSKGISKALGLIVDLIREWRRKRAARKSQAEFDAIEHRPRHSARRMFDDKDAD